MAKIKEDLIKSRQVREDILRKYGFIPLSIIEPNYSWGKKIIELDNRKQQKVAKQKHGRMAYNEVSYISNRGDKITFNKPIKAFSMSSQNVRGKSGGLSTYPPDLCHFVTIFYSDEGDLVGDPFAGHNSRMQVTYQLNRNYVGYDICNEFMIFNRKVAKEIMGDGANPMLFHSKNTITLREQTSEEMVEDDNTFDMIHTSPPYGVEFYDDNPLQIGTGESYDDTINRLTKVLSECYRTLKKNKYCIWNINDYRDKGIFRPLHADTIKAFQEVGFKLHDIIIVKWKSCIGQAFASQIEDRKVTAKTHEYLIVGKK